MKIEHAAYTMEKPVEAAKWYAEHLGFRIVKSMAESPFTHFLLDEQTGAMIEIYHNPIVDVPDYSATHPLILHLAFAVEDVSGMRERLIAAGATPEGEIDVTDAGDELAMLRDPWGFPIQLAKRGKPMA